jgi:hypothetical protein
MLYKNVAYFNPIVDVWNTESQIIEQQEKDICDIHYFCITSQMSGVYSIAEAVDSAHRNKTVIFQVIPDGFTKKQLSSLIAVVELLKLRGANAFVDCNLNRSAKILNNLFYI